MMANGDPEVRIFQYHATCNTFLTHHLIPHSHYIGSEMFSMSELPEKDRWFR